MNWRKFVDGYLVGLVSFYDVLQEARLSRGCSQLASKIIVIKQVSFLILAFEHLFNRGLLNKGST